MEINDTHVFFKTVNRNFSETLASNRGMDKSAEKKKRERESVRQSEIVSQ